MDDEPRLWHVTVTVGGSPHDAETVKAAMGRLQHQHACLCSMRYAADHAEICYWDQAAEMLDAAGMAMRVWNEHRESAALPRWEVIGLEVLERDTYQQRDKAGDVRPVADASPAPEPF